MAIYVTKNKGSDEERGKIVGVLEVSHELGHARDFISGDQWARKEADPESRGKWLYALQATRAWRIIPEDWQPVEDIFPATYREFEPQFIGASGVQARADETEALLQLEAYEVSVYGVRSPSRAVPPAAGGYWVGETDGPKHLYVMMIEGDIAAYLGCAAQNVEGKSVIKVGFSKSPLARRDQIQAAYPRGAFQWSVFKPDSAMAPAPYSCAAVAIVGEDAMKARLVDEGQRRWAASSSSRTSGWCTALGPQDASPPWRPRRLGPPSSPAAR